MTWKATFGNGAVIFTGLITIATPRKIILRALKTVMIRRNPAWLKECKEAAPFYAVMSIASAIRPVPGAKASPAAPVTT
jgi:hypothetical protein